jgi:biopolymer transport protein ExbD
MSDRGRAKTTATMVDINTTPLIDVMLVLLIMLIITIPIQTACGEDEHAGAGNAAAADRAAVRSSHRRRLRRHDRLERREYHRRPTTRARARGEADRCGGPADQPEVHLRPNKLVDLQGVAMIMASAQRLGVTKIGIVGNEQFAPPII